MNLNETDIGALFALSRDAVIGLKDNKISFCNPAARELFAMESGLPVESFLPEAFLCGNADKRVSVLTVNGKRAEVSMTQAGGLTLLYLHPVDTECTDYNLQLKTVRTLSDSLMSIRMGFDIILKRLADDSNPKLKACASLVYREYFRLKRLCEHMGTAANITQGTLPCHFDPVDLDKTFKALVESVAQISAPLGVDILYESSCRSAITPADKSLLETMLLNLISNSLLRCHEGQKLRISLRKFGENYVLSVDDDGDGMDTEAFARLFNENNALLTTDSAAGIGYGLLIARGIAECHDGNLLIESKENGGCRVRVSIPAKKITSVTFNQHDPLSELNSMNNILTELSVVLPESIYTKRFFD